MKRVVGTVVLVMAGAQPSQVQAQNTHKPWPEYCFESSQSKDLCSGLSKEELKEFYTTSQGSEILPEGLWDTMSISRRSPSGRAKKRDERSLKALAKEYGFLFTGEEVSDLPVGVTRARPKDNPKVSLYEKGDFLGVNCAACHVGEIVHNNVSHRIPGAPNLFFDVEKLFGDVVQEVRGQFSPETRRPVALVNQMNPRWALKPYEVRILRFERGTGQTNFDTLPGPGRVDAFGSVRNILFDEARPKHAPVAFPHLWGYGRADWIHWDGSVHHDVATERNIGQAIGMGAIYWRQDGKEQSTLDLKKIHKLEGIASKIRPPKWKDIFSDLQSTPDASKQRKGEVLYDQHCANCHPRPLPAKDWTWSTLCKWGMAYEAKDLKNAYFCSADGKPERDSMLIDITQVETDPQRLHSFRAPMQEQKPNGGPRDTFVDVLSRRLKQIRASLEWDGKGAFGVYKNGSTGWRQTTGYLARPLTGIWATAPYLHNNSVPTLYHLLLPAIRRPEKFIIGPRTYDTKKLGYDVPARIQVSNKGEMLMDTTFRGNSNAGHKFGTTLSEEDRMNLLEFLKTVDEERP